MEAGTGTGRYREEELACREEKGPAQDDANGTQSGHMALPRVRSTHTMGQPCFAGSSCGRGEGMWQPLHGMHSPKMDQTT
jgi:hypothetical protein